MGRRRRNSFRWASVLALAFLAGAIEAAAEESATPGRILRHGVIGCGPAVVALRLTLERRR